jgi:hypothetical protein
MGTPSIPSRGRGRAWEEIFARGQGRGWELVSITRGIFGMLAGKNKLRNRTIDAIELPMTSQNEADCLI